MIFKLLDTMEKKSDEEVKEDFMEVIQVCQRAYEKVFPGWSRALEREEGSLAFGYEG